MGGGTDHHAERGDEPPDSTRERTITTAVLELDHVYTTLSHSRRRYLCYLLLEEAEWSLTALAETIAAWEQDLPEQAVTDQQRHNVYASLYHVHVPKLVEQGVVSFDEATETVTPAENATQVLTALRGIGAALDVGQDTHPRSDGDE